MSGTPPKFMRRQYLFLCTDPVHVGTGGYRLGRVDNSMEDVKSAIHLALQ